MGAGYALAYRVGLTPWERAGEAAALHMAALLDREEAGRARPFGRALDLGCGTGAHAVQLAERGWEVTGVDTVERAVRNAQDRAAGAQASVHFLVGDVTRLRADGVTGPFDLFLDVGCLHGLRDVERTDMAAEVEALAAPGASLLLLAFQPGRRGPIPRGAGRDEIDALFPAWDLVGQDAADVTGMPGPLRAAAPQWYRLKRR